MIKKSTFLKLIIPSIMLFFFVRNLILVEKENMDSWMGGGMRMFAKIDKMIYRVAGFEVNYNSKTYFVNMRNIPELEDECVSARILPSQVRTNEILDKIRKYSWCYNSNTDTIELSAKKDSCTAPINSNDIVKVKVFAINFNNNTNKVNLKPLN